MSLLLNFVDEKEKKKKFLCKIAYFISNQLSLKNYINYAFNWPIKLIKERVCRKEFDVAAKVWTKQDRFQNTKITICNKISILQYKELLFTKCLLDWHYQF